MNVKDRSYNRQCREMDRSPPDWRMRPTSVDGRDNITRPERGPLGSGGVAATEVPHAVAVSKSGRGHAEGRSKRGVGGRMAGLALTLGGTTEGSVPNFAVPDA